MYSLRLRHLCLLPFLLLILLSGLQPLLAEDEYPDEFFTPVEEPEPPQEDGTPMLGVYMGGAGDDGGGVEIVGVIPGTAADRMGLQEGDIIRRINGREIDSQRTLVDEVINSGVGDGVAVAVTRNNEPMSFGDQYSERPRRFGSIRPDQFRDHEQSQQRPRGIVQRLLDAVTGTGTGARQQTPDADQEQQVQDARRHVHQQSPLLHALNAWRHLHQGDDFQFHFQVDVDAADLETRTAQHPASAQSTTTAPPINIDFACQVDAGHL